MLRKKEFVTMCTPIPGYIPRQLAVDLLHSHGEVITVNPLVLDYKAIKAPRNAAADEFFSTWYDITERIQYVPGIGRMGSGKISFNACFHDMPWGLQAHIYAPMGVDLRYKYTISGNQPGVEPPQVMEMGLSALGAPTDGLYLREDVEVKCNITMMSFVKTELKKASKQMVDRIIKKAELIDAGVLETMIENGRLVTSNPADRSEPLQSPMSPVPSPSPHPGSQEADHISPRPPQSPGSPVPYRILRPQSYYTAGTHSGIEGIRNGYTSPGTPGGGGINPYTRYSNYPALPGYQGQHPPNMMYGQPYGQRAQYPVQVELQGHAIPTEATNPAPAASLPVEMPGDFYHAQVYAPPRPASSMNSSPQSNRDSDILSTGKWSSTNHTQATSQGTSPNLSGSRPASVSSDASGGTRDSGYRSPGLDKGFSSELSTHRETLEEHRADALKKLDPLDGKATSGAYTYNPADFVYTPYRKK